MTGGKLRGESMAECGKECEVYSRIVGYFRPVQNWNIGKREEFGERKTFAEGKALEREFGGGKAEE